MESLAMFFMNVWVQICLARALIPHIIRHFKRDWMFWINVAWPFVGIILAVRSDEPIVWVILTGAICLHVGFWYAVYLEYKRSFVLKAFPKKDPNTKRRWAKFLKAGGCIRKVE